jgi:hypothetical protein
MSCEPGVRAAIAEMEAEHRGDVDGGYGFAEALADRVSELRLDERRHWLECLIFLVSERAPGLAGVSLEALVRDGSRESIARLASLVSDDALAPDWRDQVLLGLARIGQAAPGFDYVGYVEEGVRRDRPSVLPLIASLVRIDEASYLAVVPKFILNRLPTDRAAVESLIPALVGNLRARPSMLAPLLSSIEQRDTAAGRDFRRLIGQYLERDYVRRETSPEVWHALNSAVSS